MLPSVFDSCSPRSEILSGELKIDLFAANLYIVLTNYAWAVPPTFVFGILVLESLKDKADN